MKITTKLLDEWGACDRAEGERYSNANLKRLFRGRKSLTPLEVSRLRSVSAEDRIWVLLRPEVLGERFMPVVNAIADRAVRRHCLKCGIPAVEQWAKVWLSGEDRSYAATASAAWAASAASAAWAASAARAARAARAAWAAEAALEAADAADAADAAAAAAVAAAALDAATLATERRAQLAAIRKALAEVE